MTLARVIGRREPMAAAIELTVEAPEVARAAQPGQFAQVLPDGVLLRRPFSFHRIDPGRGTVGFLFQVVGAGTGALARLRPGDAIDILAPLGRGFRLDAGARRIAIVSGGLGVAAFPPLVDLAVAGGVAVEWLHGAGTAARLYPDPPGVRAHRATEDGSAGRHGRVTELVAPFLPQVQQLFACGPTAMLVTLARQLPGWEGERAQAALETPMGCGVGTCLGCAVPAASQGFRLACVDGPVVPFAMIDWMKMSEVPTHA
jgi:dihydroorotate dehydrogenase electron transfer subunit